MTTTKLKLPELTASQSQKHVTHNEALFFLDALVQLSVIDRGLSAPPGSPALGDVYIVGGAPTGSWIGKTNQVTAYDGAGWIFFPPVEGWKAWVNDENATVVWTGSAWILETAIPAVVSPNGASLQMEIAEELLSGLSGASVDTTIVIPNRCVLLGVSTRTVTTITGAPSYHCGPTGGTVDAYGNSLGIASGSTNIGVIGPTAFYSDTTVTLTSTGGNFTGGAARVSIQYIQLEAASS